MKYDFEKLFLHTKKIKHIINLELNKILVKYNLRHPHIPILMAIYKDQSLTLKELTEALFIDKANITRAVQDLIAQNYLVKEDGLRKYKLFLTKDGQTVTNEIVTKRQELTNLLFSKLTKEDYQNLEVIIDKISQGTALIEGETNHETNS